MSHSLLSPSASHRWLHCTPSARLCENIENESSEFAQEGTEAHSLCEYKLNSLINLPCQDPRDSMIYLCSEMEGCSDEYVSFVDEILRSGKLNYIQTECKLDCTKYVPECKGTTDCIAVVDKTLHIIDFKYGKGVLVEAENNSQLMIYALGAIDLLDELSDIEEVTLSIFQPRLSNVCSWTLSKELLLNWGEEYLKPRAEKAFMGEGEQQCGSWCKFCLIKNSCRKRAEANLELAKYEFKEPPVLEAEELSEILTKADELESWCADIKVFALEELLKGKKIDGFKLVEGRSIRKYSDEVKVGQVVTEAGYNPYEQKLLGITAMTGLLGRAKFNELLSSYVYKPKGKATLALESDKRPAININEFMDMEE